MLEAAPSKKIAHMEMLFGMTNLVRSVHPDTCFVITRSTDMNTLVFYKHTRYNDLLVGSEGILPYESTFESITTYLKSGSTPSTSTTTSTTASGIVKSGIVKSSIVKSAHHVEPVSTLLHTFYSVTKLEYLKIGQYQATIGTMPDRPFILSLLRDGGVRAVVTLEKKKTGEKVQVILFNIHLNVTFNLVGYPTLHYADLHGYVKGTKDFVHERVIVTSGMCDKFINK
jgi:hypothetical protein